MDAVGVVCEFDPLHRGHERLLRRAGESGRVLVCAMSGNFTQRGGAACVEKFARAEMAVRNGADLVLELPTVWAAWGTVIEKRDYLWDCLQEMIAIGQEHGARWVKCGRVSAAGHPHHPLYLRADSRIEDFPVEEYAARRPAAKKKRRGGGGL